MSKDDIEKLFKKPGEKRYDYFIKKVAETEEVFGLMDDEGWALLGDDDDEDILPVFPAAEFAEAFRTAADYEEYRVEAIDVTEFVEWLGDMDEDNLLVAVFPNPEFNGAVVEPEHLKKDLLKEFEKEV
jgi:Protein of unknown function (DUF2750)